MLTDRTRKHMAPDAIKLLEEAEAAEKRGDYKGVLSGLCIKGEAHIQEAGNLLVRLAALTQKPLDLTITGFSQEDQMLFTIHSPLFGYGNPVHLYEILEDATPKLYFEVDNREETSTIPIIW